ncbi:unnamed protein product [Rotaria socialis]|uniref:Uncharacterized protein n=1 Tax=Rotaria socialis TaxID=392032 RepID=A0A817SZD0_9BILA|nr:unnamed protein product [Rotaria socialis]CAF3308528.1 unnamed protein product [Rotaria socialis]CAF3415986.1 unnamed protein product [Rotaria socialis]CAF3569288.1 unnamed protein product [Rotaria socialis]CAF3652616.1 unnamed protein product [Rotaria socialis]
MGSCCGTNSTNNQGVHGYRNGQRTNGYNKFPKIIILPEDAALIYLDASPIPTPASIRLKKTLKRKFPNLVSSDNDKRILNQIDMMKARKYYIIVVGHIREATLQSILKSSKVRAIYFCLEETDLSSYFKSAKIKGCFKDQMALKKAIYYDIRLDDTY